jgi:hypothetical protein
MSRLPLPGWTILTYVPNFPAHASGPPVTAVRVRGAM